MSNLEKERLLGLTIDEAKKKLGYWWVLADVHVNWPIGWYRFQKVNKYVELKTNQQNIVTSVWYN